MKKFLITLICFSNLSIAKSQTNNYADIAIHSSTSWIDLDYVGDGITGHKLDIHLPIRGKAPFPVVICIYGSAFFSNNSKAATFYDGFGQRLLMEGFAVVSINHRASIDSIFPAQINDVKAAIRFTRANAKAFLLDSNFIAITGWSSGGHLSAMAGTSNGIVKETINGIDTDIEGWLGSFTSTSSKVDAVVDWFGPTDFLVMDSCGSQMNHNDAKSPESVLIGGPIQENKMKAQAANPISYVNKFTPPFLIFHGDKDPLVPHCQSELLFAQLQQAGIKSELVLIKGGEHGPGVMIEKYYNRMIDFLKQEWRNKKK